MIFGTSGGVTEAALRRLAERTNPALQEIRYSGVRGLEGIKKFTIEIVGKAVHTAVVSGLGNAEKLIQLIESGEEHFDFVEVMACPTGCIGGAGQPGKLPGGQEKAFLRTLHRRQERPGEALR